MKIGIDSRLIEETGVGRYIRNLIVQLATIDTENEYVLFLRRKSFDTFVLPNSRWQKKIAEVPWHTLREQYSMPGIFLREDLDLLHVPYFNVPIFYPKPYVVTIHDLTILHIHTGKATNLPPPVYWLKRIGYYGISLIGLSRAKHILAVSEETKQEIMDHFAIHESDITVTHEGVQEKFKAQMTSAKTSKRLISSPYFLYVGNAYPHKNLDTLVLAFKMFIVSDKKDTKLVLVGNNDVFYQHLKVIVKENDIDKSVIFFGPANDEQLKSLYTNGLAFIFPSLMEGFGLPGLEAMACGTPVVCSDIPVFREIYKDSALYFDPTSKKGLVTQLEIVASRDKEVEKIVKRGVSLAMSYNWKTMATKTLDIFTL